MAVPQRPASAKHHSYEMGQSTKVTLLGGDVFPVCIYVAPVDLQLGNLSRDVFEPRTSTKSWIFPLLDCFYPSPKAVKLLFWYLVACRYGRVVIRMGEKENAKLPVEVRGSRRSVLKFPNCLVTTSTGRWMFFLLACFVPHQRLETPVLVSQKGNNHLPLGSRKSLRKFSTVITLTSANAFPMLSIKPDTTPDSLAASSKVCPRSFTASFIPWAASSISGWASTLCKIHQSRYKNKINHFI